MKKFLILLSALLLSVQAQAALVSVGAEGLIIAPVTVQKNSVLSYAANGITFAQNGFNEVQGHTLASSINVEDTTIAAGTKVDSHLIFLKTDGTGLTRTARWTFDGDILGVMVDQSGTQMAATNNLFAFGNYFSDSTPTFNFLGLELNNNTDGYIFPNSKAITIKMYVNSPGDWMRVITRSAVPEVPVPAALFMFAPALLGFLGLRRKTKTAIA